MTHRNYKDRIDIKAILESYLQNPSNLLHMHIMIRGVSHVLTFEMVVQEYFAMARLSGYPTMLMVELHMKFAINKIL